MAVNQAFFAGSASVRKLRPPAGSGPAARPQPQALPAGLACLEGRASDDILREAAARAQREGVAPEQILLNEGVVSEDGYYAALADWLGLPFQAEAFEAAPDVRYPESILAGLAPDADGRWIAAPAGERIAAAAAFRRRSNLHLTIVTPTGLRRAVERARARDAAAAASSRLAALDGQATSRCGAGRVQALCLAGAAGLFVCALAPIHVGQLVAGLAASALAAGSVALRLAATSASLWPARAPEPIADADLPVYTVVVALYREAGVARALIDALDRLAYPAAKLDIKLVIEDDDADTRAALEQLALPARYQILVAPPGAPRTKPRALNVGLTQARGDLLAIFDAEDEPEADQLRKAAAGFAAAGPNVACLQARLAIDNAADGWLARLFAIEYAALFAVVNPGLSKLAAPVALGGTSNHFRVDALRDVGGWDAWNVTEDIDLGYRLARHGYRVGALDSTTHEEAPARLLAWMRQRRRWFKGWMQTLVTHTRAPARLVREAGAVQAVSALLLVAGALIGPMFGPAFAVAWIAGAAPAGGLASVMWVGVALAGCAAALIPAAIGLARMRTLELAPWLLLLPAYWLLLSVAAWWALADLLRDPFYWAKTDHGLARTSRRRLAAGVSPRAPAWRG